MNDSYLFLFTLGPVQSFISQARKTQDLFAGSRLLSALIAHATSEIKKLSGSAEVIFPTNESRSDSLPNRFLAILKSYSPQQIGEGLEKSVREKFAAIAEQAVRDSKVSSKPDGFDKQIDSFLEIYWGAIPNTNNYQASYKELEKWLGAAKNIRSFEQLGEAGRKCSLCGERNVLFYKKSGENDKKRYMENAADFPAFKYEISKGEGLCSVCTTKRLYDKTITDAFPSTAALALMATLHELKDSENIKAYKKLFVKRGHPFEAQLYFEENLTKDYLKKHEFLPEKDFEKYESEIRNLHKKISGEANAKGRKFNKYYAVIIFDGDNMGKWLSGKKLRDSSTLLTFHRELSNRLNNFAQFSKNLFKDPLVPDTTICEDECFGRAVYAGGDDFLGFVNLHHLFRALKILRAEFDRRVSEPVSEAFAPEDSDEKMTFSAGIAIAHYKSPLSMVLNQARAMEKKAKRIDEKNAVAFGLLRHSGNISETVFKWRSDEDIDHLDIAEKLTAALRSWISDKFLYSLREELLHLYVDETGIKPEIVEAELKRLINRRKVVEESDSEKVDELAASLIRVWKHSDKLIEDGGKDIDSLKNFLSFLEICSFIARETPDE